MLQKNCIPCHQGIVNDMLDSGAFADGSNRREEAVKIRDYHVRSPLLNIARTCLTCHR